MTARSDRRGGRKLKKRAALRRRSVGVWTTKRWTKGRDTNELTLRIEDIPFLATHSNTYSYPTHKTEDSDAT